MTARTALTRRSSWAWRLVAGDLHELRYDGRIGGSHRRLHPDPLVLGVGVREQPADLPAQQRGISSGQHVDAKPDVTRIRAAEQPLDGCARGRISHEQGRGIPSRRASESRSRRPYSR